MSNIPWCNGRTIWPLPLSCVRLCSDIIFVAALSERFRLSTASTRLEFWEQSLYCRTEVRVRCGRYQSHEHASPKFCLPGKNWYSHGVCLLPSYRCEKTPSKATFKRRKLTGDLLTLSECWCMAPTVGIRQQSGWELTSDPQGQAESWGMES